MSNKAALLLNLGSPDSPAVPDVRRYLSEFLMDKRVLDMSAPLRWVIVNLGILPKRSAASAKLYESVWEPDGSPLILTSKALLKEVQEACDIPVDLAMRYGNPSTDEVVRKLASDGVTELLVFPLYPHYAMSSYETAVEKVKEVIKKSNLKMRIKVVPPFYEEDGYINALVESAKPYLDKGFDQLLLSFHGIPERHLRKSDPTSSHCLQSPDCCQVKHPAQKTCYRHQCFQTAKRFCEVAGIPEEKYQISFQSRLGRDPWLTPYTDKVLEAMGGQGVQRLLIMCPAFVADCLETLEEIAIEGKEIFLEGGGSEFEMIPCMNTHPLWVEFVASKIGE